MPEVKISRRDKSESTKRKIIAAAHDEFIAKGYHGATIASVAAAAGVAPQTVYFVFHTKAALISAAIDAAVMGDLAEIPQETLWWAAMTAEPDAAEALRLFVRGSAPLFARASTLSEILRAAALTDDEVRRTYDYHEGLRREGFQAVVVGLAAKGNLRAGLTVETAADVFLTVYSDSVYHLLDVDHGWEHAQIVEWLCQALPVLLLEPPNG